MAEAQDQSSWMDEEKAYRNAGFSDDEIEHYKAQEADEYRKAGFTDDEIGQYFGKKQPNMTAIGDMFRKNLAQFAGAEQPQDKANGVPKTPHPAKGMLDMFERGLQMSVQGLIQRQKAPDVTEPPDADLGMKFAESAGQLIGDAPSMIGAGAAGTLAGGPIAGAAAAFSVPATVRKIMMDHYEKGDITTAQEFWHRAAETSWEALKGTITGGATAGAGALAEPFVAPLTKLAVEGATMNLVGAGLEGRLPNKSDLVNTAVMLGGLHGVSHITPKLMRMYSDTGAMPQDIAHEANQDPVLKQELLSQNPDLPQTTPPPVEGHLENPNFDKEQADLAAKTEGGSNPPPENPHLTDADREMLSNIGDQAEKPKPSVHDQFIQSYAKFIDKAVAVRDVYNKLEKEPSAEDAASLLSLHNAVNDKIQGWIEYGTRDFDTHEVNGEPLKAIMDDYGKEFPDDPNREKLKSFGIASRALEKAEQGKPIIVNDKPIDLEKAQEVVDTGEKTLRPYLDRLVEFGNRGLEYMHKSGFFTVDQLNAMKELNKSYFSFARIQEPDAFSNGGSGSRGVKKLYGEGGLFQDPIESQIRNTAMMIEMAERNKIKSKFVTDLLGEEGSSELVRPAEVEQRPVRISAEEITKALRAQGHDVLDGDIAEGLTTFRPRDKFKSDNQFEVWENGERQVYETASPLVAQALEKLSSDPVATDLWSSSLRKVGKFFASTVRAGTVNNPFFGLRHAYRNQRVAPVFSENGLKPFEDIGLKIAGEIDPKSEDYQRFLYEGGGVSQIVPLDKTYVENKLYDINKDTGFIGKTWNNVKTAAQFSHWAIIANDNMIRYAENRRALNNGASPTEAAFAARSVLPDYQRAGLQRSAITTSAAFLNVHIQSTAQLITALRNDPVGVTARALAYITVPSLLLKAANAGDPRIEDKPDWMKNTYDMTAIDHWRPASGLNEAMSVDPYLRRQKPDGSWEINDGPVIKMPLPFTLGITVGRGPIAIAASVKDGDPTAVENWAKEVAKSFVVNPIPNAGLPIGEQATNYSFFKGQPIVNATQEKKLPQFQYTPYTSEVAKQLGKVIGATPLGDLGPQGAKLSSPLVIDNYLRDWGGTLGQYAIQLADKMLHASGVGNTAEKPTKDWSEQPFAREFFETSNSLKTQTMDDFYSNYNKTSRFFTTVKALQKQQAPDQARQLINDHQELNFNMQQSYKSISSMNSYLQSIADNPKLSADEKRQLTTPVIYKMLQIAKSANENYKTFKKNLKTQQPTTTSQQDQSTDDEENK